MAKFGKGERDRGHQEMVGKRQNTWPASSDRWPWEGSIAAWTR